MSDPDLTAGTRRVAWTHDGKPIGHTEPLDRDWRGNVSAAAAKARSRAARAQSRARGVAKGQIGAAQKRSATRRGV
jgi:hypothetical protein